MSDLAVGKNMVASVHYTGTMPETGEVFDSSEGKDPLTFIIGHGQMIPGFETNIEGAKIGEKRTFTLTADEIGSWNDTCSNYAAWSCTI